MLRSVDVSDGCVWCYDVSYTQASTCVNMHALEQAHVRLRPTADYSNSAVSKRIPSRAALHQGIPFKTLRASGSNAQQVVL